MPQEKAEYKYNYVNPYFPELADVKGPGPVLGREALHFCEGCNQYCSKDEPCPCHQSNDAK